jgi:xanthine dehydrogenase YagS FAD-binding subunit
MNALVYERAGSVGEAMRMLAGDPDARFLAGGTNLVDLMKYGVETPGRLVDVTQLPLARIEVLPSGAVRIGALVRNSDLAEDARIVRDYPVLSQALLNGASPQLRNLATTAGNLLQRTRCYYFYDIAFPCNKRLPGSGCPAIDGQNRIHAILGQSDACIAVHPSDMAVALAMLDAVVQVQSPQGVRSIPVVEFHRLPGTTPHIDTNLQRGELITAVDLPPPSSIAARSHYLKVRDRASYAFALTSAAVALNISGGMVQDARMALGGVAHKPWRAVDAERSLRGKPANEQSYRAAAELALAGARGYAHNRFKIELAKRTLVRALVEVQES